MKTKRASKTLSLFLAFCMVFTMLPTVAFAETGDVDSGVPLGVSGIITDFAPLEEDVAEQAVEIGTSENELDLPIELTVTVTRTVTTTTGSAITATVSDNDTATDSEAQEMEPEPPAPTVQTEQRETVLAVSDWACEPAYDGTIAGTYIFTPVLVLADGLSMAGDIIVPQVTVTVQDAPALLSMRGAAADAFQVEGGATYATLEEAAAAVPDGGTITMLNDVEITNGSIALNYPKSYTIDFGGYTLKQTRNASLLYITAGIVRLKNGTLRADAADTNVANPNAYAVRIEGNSPTVIVESGTYYGYSAAIRNQYTLVIVSGDFSNTASDRGCIDGNLNGTQLMEGSFASPSKSEWSVGTRGITVTAGTATDITPPTFSIVKVVRTSNNIATVRFKTEEIIGFSLYYLVYEKGTTAPAKEEVRENGALLGSISYGEANQYPTISAGDKDVYFVGVDVAGNICEPVKTEVNAITENFRVEGGDTYTTLDEAVQAVPNGGTITMLKEVTVAKPSYVDFGIVLEANKSYTIDFGGNLLRTGDNSRIRLYLMLIKQGSVVLKNGEIKANKDNGQNLMPSAVGAYGASTTVDIINMNISGSDNAVSALNGSTTTLWSGIFKSLTPPISAMYEENGQIVLASGSTVAPTSSWKNAATVTVTAAPIVNAAIPTITVQPVNASYTQGETATPLSVEASVSDGGTLSYQWYSNSFDENSQGLEIRGETSSTYTPSTGEFDVGTVYYYCEVSNTKENKISRTLSDTAKITVEAPSGSGVTKVANAEQLKTELEKTVAQTVEITGGFTVTEPIFMASNHELRIPSDKTLTFSGEGRIRFGTGITAPAHALTINGGGNLVLSCTGNYIGISGSAGTLNLSNITVTVVNCTGINVSYLNVGTGATIISEEVNESTPIHIFADGICTVNTGGLIDIRGYSTTGINLNGSMLHINGGTVTFVMNEVGNSGISVRMYGNSFGSLEYTSGTLSGSDGAAISFNKGTKAEGLNGKFSDQNHILSTSGAVTVGDATAAPSTNGLTAGAYYWDGSRFAKHAITINSQPQDISVTEGAISGSLSVSGTASNGKTVTYQWMKADQDSIFGPAYIIPGATSNIFTIPTDLTEGSYYYYCDLRAAECSSMQSDIATVTVNAPDEAPTITITKHPQNVTVTQGRINATLTAEAVASNGKPVRYQWRRFIGGIGSDNTQPLLGETSNTFTIPTGLTAGTYQYLCVFNTDGTDYVDSNTAIVTVKPPFSDGSGGGSGSSSGGNGGSGVVVTPPAPDAPNSPTQGSADIYGTVDSNGNITANITNQTVSDTIDKALAQARKNGTEQNGIILTLNISTGGKPVNNLTVNLPKEVQDAIIAKGVSGLIITAGGSDIAIGMDLTTLREMNRQAGGNINLTATRMNNATLAGKARAAIGNRPVFDLKAKYGNGRTVQNFGAGSVSVTIPYTLGTNENAGNIQAVYVDANAQVQWLISSVYDSVNGVLHFSTNHFSAYGVGYKQDAPSFTDIGSHWAKEDIVFVANRELLSGTSATTFSPNTAMTRGMFVKTLGRLANADVSGYKKSSFTDVKNDAYYMVYIEWASKNNIVKGIGDGKFASDQSITREQMAVILQSYAKAIGFTLRKVHAENTFSDSAKISAYAKDAVKQMQMAGVISGKNGNLFDPQGTATRAEVSAVLCRFVELAISSDMAQGWTMNDSGKWMYYENGKPVTGKKNIDGSTYTFDQYGVTADTPKNLKYTTYTVQKGDSFWLIAQKLGCTMSELERLNNKSRFDLIHPSDLLRVPEK